MVLANSNTYVVVEKEFTKDGIKGQDGRGKIDVGLVQEAWEYFLFLSLLHSSLSCYNSTIICFNN